MALWAPISYADSAPITIVTLEFQKFTFDAIDYRTEHSCKPIVFSFGKAMKSADNGLGKKSEHGVLQAFRARKSGPGYD